MTLCPSARARSRGRGYVILLIRLSSCAPRGKYNNTGLRRNWTDDASSCPSCCEDSSTDSPPPARQMDKNEIPPSPSSCSCLDILARSTSFVCLSENHARQESVITMLKLHQIALSDSRFGLLSVLWMQMEFGRRRSSSPLASTTPALRREKAEQSLLEAMWCV